MSVSAFKNPEADVWTRDNRSLDAALERTTHLGIGAHQDDLEFMAYEGIAACYERDDHWFAGVTVTDGRGSSRAGPYASYTDEQMRDERREEQREAARIGRYTAQMQLDYSSSELKGDRRGDVVEDLCQILARMKPHTVYLHQPADKHDSHIATLACSVEALRRIAPEHLPDRVVGCEGWRGLDWLDDAEKIPMVCDAYPELVEQFYGVFKSQIVGGKRYDLAIEGRRIANATMFDSHGSDTVGTIIWGIDLKPLIADPSLSMTAFIDAKIQALSADVAGRIDKFV